MLTTRSSFSPCRRHHRRQLRNRPLRRRRHHHRLPRRRHHHLHRRRRRRHLWKPRAVTTPRIATAATRVLRGEASRAALATLPSTPPRASRTSFDPAPSRASPPRAAPPRRGHRRRHAHRRHAHRRRRRRRRCVSRHLRAWTTRRTETCGGARRGVASDAARGSRPSAHGSASRGWSPRASRAARMSRAEDLR